jgi:hypothetical protein
MDAMVLKEQLVGTNLVSAPGSTPNRVDPESADGAVPD